MILPVVVDVEVSKIIFQFFSKAKHTLEDNQKISNNTLQIQKMVGGTQQRPVRVEPVSLISTYYLIADMYHLPLSIYD